MACAPSEDSDQPGHPPSLISLRCPHWALSYTLSAQRRLLSDLADPQAYLSLRWAHMPFCWVCHETVQICNNNKIQLYKYRVSQKYVTFGPGHAKMCLMSYANNKGADQAFFMRTANTLIRLGECPDQTGRMPRSDWADAQADLSLRWAHIHFVGFIMRRLKRRLRRTPAVLMGISPGNFYVSY